ncbi:ribonucleotide-diphosphate reductase subunit beta [Halocatena halophila]|uniref:ribonucleotide-diphosphate reductase subunit beta n=1 Tax=Halocatena halophila TaxID=2814576 RepID=UPI002ED20A36
MDNAKGTDQLQETDPSLKNYRDAVRNHWDPAEIDYKNDVEALVDLDEVNFTVLRSVIAQIGLGEEDVVEDLHPFFAITKTTSDAMFLSTQQYEEAKHADFFTRYWYQAINSAEDIRGMETTEPDDDQWLTESYIAQSKRLNDDMNKLLDKRSPHDCARAFANYHLTQEGILFQSGFHWLRKMYNGNNIDNPRLPALMEGAAKISQDEARHVDYGVRKLTDLVEIEQIDPVEIDEHVSNVLPLIQDLLSTIITPKSGKIDEKEIIMFMRKNHTKRMKNISKNNQFESFIDSISN